MNILTDMIQSDPISAVQYIYEQLNERQISPQDAYPLLFDLVKEIDLDLYTKPVYGMCLFLIILDDFLTNSDHLSEDFVSENRMHELTQNIRDFSDTCLYIIEHLRYIKQRNARDWKKYTDAGFTLLDMLINISPELELIFQEALQINFTPKKETDKSNLENENLYEDDFVNGKYSNKNISLSAYQGNDDYIFVSYSHKNSDIVYPILEILHVQGYHIWYDEGIKTGKRWSKVIEEHLEKMKVLLLFVTPESMASENVMDEFEYALDSKIDIIRIDLVETKVPYRLRRIQALRHYNHKQKNQFIEKLKESLPDSTIDQTLAPFTDETNTIYTGQNSEKNNNMPDTVTEFQDNQKIKAIEKELESVKGDIEKELVFLGKLYDFIDQYQHVGNNIPSVNLAMDLLKKTADSYPDTPQIQGMFMACYIHKVVAINNTEGYFIPKETLGMLCNTVDHLYSKNPCLYTAYSVMQCYTFTANAHFHQARFEETINVQLRIKEIFRLFPDDSYIKLLISTLLFPIQDL